MEKKRVEVGMRFGKWVILSQVAERRHGTIYWNCRCDCGRERAVSRANLLSGASQKCRTCGVATHRGSVKGQEIPEFKIWQSMVKRCRPGCGNKNYAGRGISVCERWLEFDAFYADMGQRPTPQHSIEREDNDGNYCPENCRWATAAEQQNNRRNNRRITAGGKTLTLKEWSRVTGINYETLISRLHKLKWSEVDAVTKPLGSK